MVVRVIIAALGLEECSLSLGLNWANQFEVSVWNWIDWSFRKTRYIYCIFLKKMNSS